MVILTITSAGCATTTDELSVEEAEFVRTDAELTLIDEFNAKVERCKRSGGYMVLPQGVSKKSNMKRAFCDKNWRSMKGVFYN